MTSIPFSSGIKILGSDHATGTLGNCCGRITPWGTFLSCEENYDNFYGEAHYDAKNRRTVKKSDKIHYAWDVRSSHPPEHYGWVNEINPQTGEIKKLVQLGRFAHEGATVTSASDGRAVVYVFPA